jgi:hypothetical protein
MLMDPTDPRPAGHVILITVNDDDGFRARVTHGPAQATVRRQRMFTSAEATADFIRHLLVDAASADPAVDHPEDAHEAGAPSPVESGPKWT